MKVRLHNTLTGKVQPLSPSTPGEVRLYSCGPTVYTYAHVGNLRTYIFSDVLRRALRSAGFRVRHVMSVTDVGHLQSDADEGEDKMALAANREARSPGRSRGSTRTGSSRIATVVSYYFTARLNYCSP